MYHDSTCRLGLALNQEGTVVSNWQQRSIVRSVVGSALRTESESNVDVECVVDPSVAKTTAWILAVTQVENSSGFERHVLSQWDVKISSDDSLIVVSPATINFFPTSTDGNLSQKDSIVILRDGFENR